MAAYLSVGSVLIIYFIIIIYHVYRYGCSKAHYAALRSKVGKTLARNLSYTTKFDRENPSEYENSIFSAIDDAQSRYVPLYDQPMKATSSELSLTNSSGCNDSLSHSKRERSTTDLKQNGDSVHYHTDVPQRSSSMHSKIELQMKTEPAAVYSAYVSSSNEKIKQHLLEDEV